ncbi:hypothetical protein AVEN_91315-1 [Araneus ventricosus]|uniref:Uncharacterized protein n=1 Tax=Araneus ventricosus TaxID=182803 RepID=A0A4Y2ETH2_ARAVE|nr:hypothetical protein AVEN_91315-1 [Araneus ventricosus]
MLKAIHKQRRVDWAKYNQNWKDQWHHVIFSDEKKFNLDDPDGLEFNLHDMRKKRKSSPKDSKYNYGSGEVMVTGANRGIGLEFLKQLVELPKPPRFVFATYRDENKTQRNAATRRGIDSTSRGEYNRQNLDFIVKIWLRWDRPERDEEENELGSPVSQKADNDLRLSSMVLFPVHNTYTYFGKNSMHIREDINIFLKNPEGSQKIPFIIWKPYT